MYENMKDETKLVVQLKVDLWHLYWIGAMFTGGAVFSLSPETVLQAFGSLPWYNLILVGLVHVAVWPVELGILVGWLLFRM